jgi:hypothetical protein
MASQLSSLSDSMQSWDLMSKQFIDIDAGITCSTESMSHPAPVNPKRLKNLIAYKEVV